MFKTYYTVWYDRDGPEEQCGRVRGPDFQTYEEALSWGQDQESDFGIVELEEEGNE